MTRIVQMKVLTIFHIFDTSKGIVFYKIVEALIFKLFPEIDGKTCKNL